MSHESVDTHVPTSGLAVRDAQAMSAYDITASESAICQFAAYLHREAFSPIPIPRGLKCHLYLAGVCYMTMTGMSRSYGIDALNEELDPGNFTYRHKLLFVDRNIYERDALAEDRALHRYVLPYTGTGGRLAILLKTPKPDYSIPNQKMTGSIEVAVLPAPKVIQVAAQPVGVDDAREEEESRRRHALVLATKAHLESNFLDQEYRERYAATYLARILTEEKEHWLNLYRNVLADQALYTLIQSEHPHVLTYLENLLETARIADRLAVVDPRKKPKLSHEEWEARIERYRQRQVDRLRVGADDKIAKLLARYKSLQHLRERAEQLGLDSETIERLEQELRGDMDDEDDSQSTGYRQLG